MLSASDAPMIFRNTDKTCFGFFECSRFAIHLYNTPIILKGQARCDIFSAMIAHIESMPETGAGDMTPGLLDKNDLAKLLKLSPRSISNWMERGLPHLRLGERRVRFVGPDVMKWFQQTCGCQRVGKLNGNGVRQ